MYKEADTIDVSSFPIRARFGAMMAPTRMVEFTDMLCGHCAALASTVKELKKALPDGLLSIEARQYPLDGECNPQVMRTDGSGTRCMAAKAQICLENAPDFWDLREKLFEAQRTLTKDSVVSIASSGSVSKDALVRCIESPETRQKLADDIAYATRFDIQGTPLVLLNGKQGTPMGAFLYAMALSRADVNAPAFGTLPPAQPHAAHDGHGH
jgi:serine/threonine-protein kinase